mmetsp:Transcript_2426/g.5419  ORF Transcript_2426/g.5419 Transcript_2426/m.5419 type:complete len:86 (+) Transcript_2426:1326-1583(+)
MHDTTKECPEGKRTVSCHESGHETEINDKRCDATEKIAFLRENERRADVICTDTETTHTSEKKAGNNGRTRGVVDRRDTTGSDIR